MFQLLLCKKLKHSRFFITEGAAKDLTDVKNKFWDKSPWDIRKKQKALLKLSKENIFLVKN